MKRMMLVAALMLLAVTSVFAMGGGETSAESEYDRIVTTTVTATYLNETWFNTMNADFEAETGIHVVVQPVPGDEDEYKAKINIDLMGGSTVDASRRLARRITQDRCQLDSSCRLTKLSRKLESIHIRFMAQTFL